MKSFMISIAVALTLSFAGSSFALTQNEMNGLTYGCQSAVDPNEANIELAYDEATKVVAVRQSRHLNAWPLFQELDNDKYTSCKFIKGGERTVEGNVQHFDSYYQCKGKPSFFVVKLSVPIRNTSKSIKQCQVIRNN